MNKKRTVLLMLTFLAFGMVLATSNYQFQFEKVEASTWETVEHIEGIQDLNFAPAATGNDYVDATQSQTYGTTSNMPPTDGMGYDSGTYSVLQETSNVVTTYPDKTTYTGGSLPSGWTNSNWGFSGVSTNIYGWQYSSGYFYTNTHDMSSYDGVRVRFVWRDLGGEDTEFSDLESTSYEGSSVKWFECPAGRQTSWKAETRNSAWHSTGWYCRWNADGLTGDVENFEAFGVDNIYLEGKSVNTYYRFEAVYRFDSIDYAYYNSRLYIDWNAGSSSYIDVYGGTTTNPTTLIADHKNNDFDINIDSTLAGSPYYIKIVDEDQTNEIASLWYLSRCYIAIVNTAPENTATPVCTNLDDSTYLYARYKTYIFTSNFTDVDGYANLDYVELWSHDYDTTNLRWRIRFDEDDNLFSEITGDDIELDTSGSSYVKSGDDLDVTWRLKIEWTHLDEADNDLWQSARDANLGTDGDLYDSNYDYETRLDWSSVPTVTDDDAGTVDRGDTDETFTMEGTLKYYGSSLVPLDTEVDVWVSCAAVASSPWSDLLGSSGTYTVTCSADDVVGLDDYTMKPVKNTGGSGGASLYYTTDLTDAYIADKIVIQTTVSSDAQDRLDVNGNVEIRVTASLAYTTGGTVWLGSGDTMTLDDVSMTWDAGNSWFDLSRSQSSVGLWNYFVNSSSETGHGVTGLDLNSKNVEVIWDRVRVVSYTIVSPSGDNRNNIGTTYTIDIELHYDYDETDVADGTITVNGEPMDSYEGLGKWRWTPYQAEMIGINYNYMQAIGNAYGITVEDNTVTQLIIWDRIYTVSLSYGGDTRIDVGTSVNFDYGLHYDYDETDVTDGTITINGKSFEHQGSGIWRYTTSNGGDVGSITLNSIAASGNTHGITSTSASLTVTLIWDRVIVMGYWTDDGRIDVSTESSNYVWLQYEYDSINVTNGDVYENGGAISVQAVYSGAGGTWNFGQTKTGAQNETYGSIAYGGGTYNLYAENQNGQTLLQIWDWVFIRITVPVQDGALRDWTIIGYNLTIVSFTSGSNLYYEYDNEPFLGTYTVNGSSMPFYPIQQVGGEYFYTVDSIDDSGGYGLTAFVDVLGLTLRFDEIEVSVNYKWTQYSPVEVWLIWDSALFHWKSDAEPILDGLLEIRSEINGTADDIGYINDEGYCGDLNIGDFDASWHYANISIYAHYDEIDYLFWTQILSVDILHSIHVEDSGMDIQDVWITFIVHTNWGNASYTIWDNDTMVGSSLEGWYQVVKPTVVGLHNYTVLINGTHGVATDTGQTKDFSIDDSWTWLNFKLTVNPTTLSVTEGALSVAYDEVSYSGTSTKDASVTIYENDAQVGSTSISEGDFAFFWTRASASSASSIRYSLKFVNGTDTVWRNGSYSKVVITAFSVEQWWMRLQLSVESYVEFYVLTSWENATIYVYDNETLMTTVTESAGGAYSYFWMSETQGLHTIVLNITHGSTVFTKTRTYYVPDWAVTGLVVRWDLYTFQNNYTLIQLESNWMNCTYYVYLNDSEVAVSSLDPVTLNISRSINEGEYNLTIFADGGTQNWTVSNIRYVVAAEGVTYDYSEVTITGGGHADYWGDVYHEYTYENPEGIYLTSEVVFIIIAACFLVPIAGYLALDKLEIARRLKLRGN